MNELVQQAVSIVPAGGMTYEAWVTACVGQGILNLTAIVPKVREQKLLRFSVETLPDGTRIHRVEPSGGG